MFIFHVLVTDTQLGLIRAVIIAAGINEAHEIFNARAGKDTAKPGRQTTFNCVSVVGEDSDYFNAQCLALDLSNWKEEAENKDSEESEPTKTPESKPQQATAKKMSVAECIKVSFKGQTGNAAKVAAAVRDKTGRDIPAAKISRTLYSMASAKKAKRVAKGKYKV